MLDDGLSRSTDRDLHKVYKSNVTFTESGKRGLDFKIVVSYADCEKTEISSIPYINRAYEINRKIIFLAIARN